MVLEFKKRLRRLVDVSTWPRTPNIEWYAKKYKELPETSIQHPLINHVEARAARFHAQYAEVSKRTDVDPKLLITAHWMDSHMNFMIPLFKHADNETSWVDETTNFILSARHLLPAGMDLSAGEILFRLDSIREFEYFKGKMYSPFIWGGTAYCLNTNVLGVALILKALEP